MLEVVDVSLRYGERLALDQVSLAIGRGQIFALLGPNGAGKSSLVSVICGLLPPTSGEVRIDGLAMSQRRNAMAGRLGFAPQDLGIYPPLTVRQNLEYFARLRGAPRASLAASIEDAAEMFGVTHLMGRRAYALSGGEQRRLQSATAVVGRPPLIVLDEPTAGLDVESRAMTTRAVSALARSGSAICYTTHYLEELSALDVQIGILDHGRLLLTGARDEIMARSPACVVEFRFTRDIGGRAFARARDAQWHGVTLRAPTQDPTATTLAILEDLKPSERERLGAIEVIRPSFEAVFLSLTGRRYGVNEPEEA